MTRPILNFLAFQLSWAANVLGAAGGMPWVGPCVLAAWMVLHFSGHPGRRGPEVALLAGAAVLGYAADSALVLAGIIGFEADTRLGGPSPLWMVALWIGFAATLRHSLRWLGTRYLLGAALGALLGPLAYFAGAGLGAIVLAAPPAWIIGVGLEWAIAMPVLMAAANAIGREARVLRSSAPEVTS